MFWKFAASQLDFPILEENDVLGFQVTIGCVFIVQKIQRTKH